MIEMILLQNLIRNKKSTDKSQTDINNYYENFPTSLIKNDQINKALAKFMQSIYDYCLIIEEQKKYLWYSKSYSDISHHNEVFLGDEFIKIVDEINSEKLVAIVSDNAFEAQVA
ncbi:6034_t:CDS:2 [Funneliformis mosseae]|uniref:6034_t:CDS:1 n=1 Tax=Funneliformis mosseae TaxID=27381 RepID=A0A9N9E077_FUNMO|nr:6034_t:CDS:2 [Funneliformis mosseae]